VQLAVVDFQHLALGVQLQALGQQFDGFFNAVILRIDTAPSALMRSITCLTESGPEAPAVGRPPGLAFKPGLIELTGVIDHVGLGAQARSQLAQAVAVGLVGLPPPQ
jgi:hypothetical protein